MTAKQLIKRLEAIVAKHGNVQVGVDLDSLGKDFSVANISTVEVDVVNQVDGDGFCIENKDGSQRVWTMAVLK